MPPCTAPELRREADHSGDEGAKPRPLAPLQAEFLASGHLVGVWQPCSLPNPLSSQMECLGNDRQRGLVE